MSKDSQKKEDEFKELLVSIKPLAKKFHVQELFRTLRHAARPNVYLRRLLTKHKGIFLGTILAYLEAIAFVLLFENSISRPLFHAAHYPLVLSGKLVEDSIIFYTYLIICLALGLFIIYKLPNKLFEPMGRVALLTINIQMAIYSMLYLTAADYIKLLLWVLFKSFPSIVLFGVIVNVILLIWQLYIWRKVLQLRWKAIIIILVVTSLTFFAIGMILGFTGLVNFK